jgi:ABC-type branched-subunit amino acid transport system substrate-binding protein
VTSIGAAAVAESYGIPLLAPTATDPELPGIGPHVLTLSPDPDRLARPLASLTVGVLGKTRFGVLLARDGVSQEYERAFREAVEALGGEVVVSLAYDPDERDFRRLIERFDEQNVDAVYIPGSVGNLEALAVQLDFYEFGRMILGNGGWTDARILDPGNLALEGAIFSVESADHPDSEFRLRLRRSVWEAAREEVSRFHIRGYQAMASLLAAMDAGARGSEAIVESLRLRDYWPVPAEPDRLHLLTFRDGALGPASWAVGFDLVPKVPPEEPEEEEELEAEGVPAAAADGMAAEPLAPDEEPAVPADGGPRD